MIFTKKEYNCPLCSKDTTKLLLGKQGFSIVQCNDCSFVYVNPRIANEDLGRIYEHNYFTNKSYGYIGYQVDKRLRIRNFKRWLQDAKKFMPVEKKVNALDIGCAAGYCLDVMKTNGWNAYGLELDEEMYNNLKISGYNVYHTKLEDFESPQRYTVICLFDVIEHITSLDTAFEKLFHLLDDEGVIVIVTPNYNSLQRKLFRKKWFQYKPIEHIQYFTKESLTVFAERNGLQVIHHNSCGQYADTHFILDRLDYYRYDFLSKVFKVIFKLFRLSNRFFYTDTGSLFAVLKKK